MSKLLYIQASPRVQRSIVVEPTLQGGPDVAEVKRKEAINKAKEMANIF